MGKSGRIAIMLVVVLAIACGGYYYLHNRSSATATGATATGAAMTGGSNMRERFTQFREEHRYTFMLMQLASGIVRLEDDPAHAVSSAQAKQLLAVLQPLRTQPTLTQDEAKNTIKAIQSILTAEQRDAINKLQPERNRQQGGPGAPGMGRPSGQRPQGGGRRMPMDLDAMKNFNPFNASQKSPMAQRGGRGIEQLFTVLEKKAS